MRLTVLLLCSAATARAKAMRSNTNTTASNRDEAIAISSRSTASIYSQNQIKINKYKSQKILDLAFFFLNQSIVYITRTWSKEIPRKDNQIRNKTMKGNKNSKYMLKDKRITIYPPEKSVQLIKI